jgi:hypothetical protein
MAWWMAIGAAAGALMGGVSAWQQGEQEQEALEQRKAAAWQEYMRGRRFSDERYALQRAEAHDQAALAQRRLDEGVGMSVDQMNTSLLAQAFGVQDARIQTASGIGASRAAEGASGTRGNAAAELTRAYAAQGLERGIEVQNRRNADELRNLTARAGNAAADIARERDSWDPGGSRWQMKELQDAYNRDIAELGQSGFGRQIDQAGPTFLDYASGVLGGASSGMSLADSMYEFKENWLTSPEVRANAWENLGGAAELGINSYMTDYSNPLGINSNTFIKNYQGNKL